MSTPGILCSYEDRPAAMDAAVLMAASLQQHHPNVRLKLHLPECPVEIATRAKALPRLELATDRCNLAGWDVKPLLLLDLLSTPRDRVGWLDTDLVVRRPLLDHLAGQAGLLVAAEEWRTIPPSSRITTAWRLTPGRDMPEINSCLLSVTNDHIPLLQAWAELLNDERYRKAQQLPFSQRPPHLASDQQVLVALLGSSKFADIPFRLAKNGAVVGHCSGLSGMSVSSRRKRSAAVVHAIGRKPWDRAPGFKGYLYNFEADVSPYTLQAKHIAKELGHRLEWVKAKTLPGRVLRLLHLNDPMWTGMGPAAVHQVKRHYFG